MRERSGERDQVGTETEKPGKASALGSWPPCPRSSAPAGAARPPALPARGPGGGPSAARAGGGGGAGGGEGGAAGGRRPCGSSSLFFFFFYPFSLSSLLFLSKQGKVFREAVASFRLALPSPTLVPAPVWARAAGRALEAPSAPGGGGRGDWALGGFPRRHMAAAAPRAPRGAAPSLSEVRRLRPAAPEPSSG